MSGAVASLVAGILPSSALTIILSAVSLLSSSLCLVFFSFKHACLEMPYV